MRLSLFGIILNIYFRERVGVKFVNLRTPDVSELYYDFTLVTCVE